MATARKPSVGELFFGQLIDTLAPDAGQAETLVDFAQRVEPAFVPYRHAVEICRVLDEVARHERRRVMVFLPPRHGKSTTISTLLPAYYLRRHPERWVGIACHTDSLATFFSRRARDYFTRDGGNVRRDASGVTAWQTMRPGGLWAAGIGGPITGKGFNLGVIDDPIKSPDQLTAEFRDKQWDWFQTVFYTRREPEASIVLTVTRWHEDDLAGRILNSKIGHGWHVVSLPAIAEDRAEVERELSAKAQGSDPVHLLPEHVTVEPDWREPGAALCPERFPIEELESIRASTQPRFWAALYQQRPRPIEGRLIQRAWFPIVEASPAPANAPRVRCWDEGASDSGDPTAGARVSFHEGVFYVENVERMWKQPGERDVAMRNVAEQDGIGVVQWGQQEPGSAGKTRAAAFVSLMRGFRARTAPATGDKVLRADALIAQAQAGHVKLVRGEWNGQALEELASFPDAAHDDVVDCLSDAINKLAQRGPTRGIR